MCIFNFPGKKVFFENPLTNPRPNDSIYLALALVAQLDRVFGYEPKGRGFESLLAYQLQVDIF